MKTFIEKQQVGLIKKFHTLMNKVGMDAFDKECILADCGVKSTKDLSIEQLIKICDRLDTMANPHLMELDKLRKRVIASIGDYLRTMGYKEDINAIKSVACRASGSQRFNEIPTEKLRALYNAFNHYKKVMKAAAEITEELIIS